MKIEQAIIPHPSELDWENVPMVSSFAEWETETSKTLEIHYLCTLAGNIYVYSLAHAGRRPAQIAYVNGYD